jgi:TfoX/Sxy family transcriptional regulator of competence genes
MAFDEILAARVREALTGRGRLTERKMFGGVCFMLEGHMCCGLSGPELMVRVGPEGYATAMARPHARAMDFTGRPLTGFVYVAAEGLRTSRMLDWWIERASAFVLSLPAHRPRKKTKPRPAPRRRAKGR